VRIPAVEDERKVAAFMPGHALYTIGHSTLAATELLALLQEPGIETVVDVRTIPRSRHNPQFNQDALARMLGEAGLEYAHRKALGGLRHPRKDSVNLGWRNASFRGYADYMQTEEFARALAELEQMAEARRTAIMCAEAVPWRCHRGLIADALTVRGRPVLHIQSRGTPPTLHQLTPFMRTIAGRPVYPLPD
jgi:uncharacterized protein (DUF488 family)